MDVGQLDMQGRIWHAPAPLRLTWQVLSYWRRDSNSFEITELKYVDVRSNREGTENEFEFV